MMAKNTLGLGLELVAGAYDARKRGDVYCLRYLEESRAMIHEAAIADVRGGLRVRVVMDNARWWFVKIRAALEFERRSGWVEADDVIGRDMLKLNDALYQAGAINAARWGRFEKLGNALMLTRCTRMNIRLIQWYEARGRCIGECAFVEPR